jgi:hypothetical protein
MQTVLLAAGVKSLYPLKKLGTGILLTPLADGRKIAGRDHVQLIACGRP